MLDYIVGALLYLQELKRRICYGFAVTVLLIIGTVVMWQELVVTYVVCDEDIVTVLSFTDDTELIVGRSGLKKSEDNTVITEYFDAQVKESLIVVTKPHDVLIYDEGKLIKIVTVSGTVGDAIEKSGIKLKDGDKLSVGKKVPVTENMKVDIYRAFTVTLKSDGRTQKLRTTECTVADFLKTAGVRVGADDIVTPKLTKKLTEKTKVQVKRVTYKEVKKTVTVEYETEVKYDDSMYEEQVKVERKGKNGKQINYYKKKYIDGKYDSKELVKTEITKEPVSKIVVWGSKPSLYGGNVAKRVISELTPPYRIDMDENNRPIKYKKKIVGKATAYCTGTVTSTGRRAQPGVVAVDPREIPYGSKLYIVSSDNRYVYGYAIAGDTGGFIYNSDTVVDLYIRGYSAAKQFGRRTVEIYVLE
ncbi:MAG: DUF348 domain-containing protein [Clostridia bacterium]|nr:DUF348 domain-containing protein [Clostridia bacterium]